MPLKLKPPRPGKSPFYTVRGTHLGVYLDRSTKTANEALARKLKKKWEAEIETGEARVSKGPTFLEGALDYIKKGGDPRFLGSFDEKTKRWDGLIGHFGETPMAAIRQAEIDEAAEKLYPLASGATKNRQVHAVVSIILKRAGFEFTIRRPSGAAGKKMTNWLTQDQAFALLREASKLDAEFGVMVTVMLYTGMRLSEALNMQIDTLEVDVAMATLPKTKNGAARGVYLPTVVLDALAKHPRGLQRPGQRVFRFTKCGRTYTLLSDALKAAGITLPPRSAFHVFRHTWATWMRRYGGLDTRGLVGTGAWKDAKSAARYEHVVASEEAKRADMLPVDNSHGRGKVVDTKAKPLRKKK